MVHHHSIWRIFLSFFQPRFPSKSKLTVVGDATSFGLKKALGTLDTVDGFRNPKQPPNMYETLQIMGYLPYQLVHRLRSTIIYLATACNVDAVISGLSKNETCRRGGMVVSHNHRLGTVISSGHGGQGFGKIKADDSQWLIPSQEFGFEDLE